MAELKGVITPTITPMNKENPDYEAIDRLMDFLARIGVNGIFPMGSTGLFSIISMEMEIKVLEYFMDKKREGMYFLAGVGRNSLDDTLTMGSYAKELGADGLSIVTPYYVRMSQEALFNYYDKLLGGLDISVLVYNIPQNTGNSITPETVLKLRNDHSNLVGIKDSSGNFTDFSQFIDVLGKDFRIFQGQDDLLLPSLIAGASGGICGTSNFLDLPVRVYREHSGQNIEKARQIQKVLTSVKKFINQYDFPLGYMAAFMEMILLRNTETVYPLDNLDADTRKAVKSGIESIINMTEI